MSRGNRKAVAWAIAGVAALFGLPAASALTPAADLPIFVCAALVAFVFCGARAMRLCCADGVVFDETRRRSRYAPPSHDDETEGRASVFEFLHRRTLSRHP